MQVSLIQMNLFCLDVLRTAGYGMWLDFSLNGGCGLQMFSVRQCVWDMSCAWCDLKPCRAHYVNNIAKTCWASIFSSFTVTIWWMKSIEMRKVQICPWRDIYITMKGSICSDDNIIPKQFFEWFEKMFTGTAILSASLTSIKWISISF